MSLLTTPSQTVGPFFHLGMSWLCGDVAGPKALGARFAIEGVVLDGAGTPVADALIEVWQANAQGAYGSTADLDFSGFGRVATDETGRFRFVTMKPGRVLGPDGVMQAPHLTVALFMRGLLRHLMTRIYFSDDPANADDPVLKRVPPARRDTLVAKSTMDGQVLQWNVVLQGEKETVFFDY